MFGDIFVAKREKLIIIGKSFLNSENRLLHITRYIIIHNDPFFPFHAFVTPSPPYCPYPSQS